MKLSRRILSTVRRGAQAVSANELMTLPHTANAPPLNLIECLNQSQSSLNPSSAQVAITAEVAATSMRRLGPRLGFPGRNSGVLDSLELSHEDLASLISQQSQSKKPLDQDFRAWQSRMQTDCESILSNVQKVPISLDDIIGVTGKKPPRDRDWREYIRFLAPLDLLGLLKEMIADENLGGFRLTDLGTVMDLSLITWALPSEHSDSKLTILEVGGGYGRLAEGFLSTWPNHRFRYILVDAVPSSLLGAKSFLEGTLDSAKVELVAKGLPSEDADVILIPSWNQAALDWISDVDVFVNIESFQEMTQTYVSFWLDLADRALKNDGIAYISNSRSYVNAEEWPIPSRWQLEFFTNTPRSWTEDHPTAIFTKSLNSEQKFSLLRRLATRIWKEHSN